MSSYLSSGDSGTLGTEWSVQNARRNNLSRLYGTVPDNENGKIDFQSSLVMMGVDDEVVLDKLEFNVLGFDKRYDGDLLDWNSSAWSSGSIDDRLFQASGHDLFTNIDLENGTFKVMDERTFTEELGFDWDEGGKPYDVLEITSNRINFYDFIFAGFGDGKQDQFVADLEEFSLNPRWGINNYVWREVNPDLAYAPESGDYESYLAHDTLRLIQESIPTWMTAKIANELADYEVGSDEYNKKFIELAFELMDQEGYLKGNEIEDPKVEDKPIKPTPIPVTPGNGEPIITTDADGIQWSRPSGVTGGSETAQIGDYTVSRTVATDQHYYTVTGKDGQKYQFSQKELDASGQKLADYIDSLVNKSDITNIPVDEPLTGAMREVGGEISTQAMGEEGGGYRPINPIEIEPLTGAMHEVGGGDFNVSTQAMGEEGGNGSISDKVRIIDNTFISPIADGGLNQNTTMALNETGNLLRKLNSL